MNRRSFLSRAALALSSLALPAAAHAVPPPAKKYPNIWATPSITAGAFDHFEFNVHRQDLLEILPAPSVRTNLGLHMGRMSVVSRTAYEIREDRLPELHAEVAAGRGPLFEGLESVFRSALIDVKHRMLHTHIRSLWAGRLVNVTGPMALFGIRVFSAHFRSGEYILSDQSEPPFKSVIVTPDYKVRVITT